MSLPAGLPSALFNTVIDAVRAVPAVAAACGDRVYDVVPAQARAPYVFLGPCGFQDARDIGCADAWRFRLRLYVAAQSFGRLLAWDIAFAIAEALHETAPAVPLPGYSLPMPVTVVNGGDIIDPLKLKEAFVDLDVVLARNPA